jgi:ribonuclease HI
MWGVVKCNVDAALFRQQNSCETKEVNFIRAKTLHKQQLLSPKEAEAMGLKEALVWLHEKVFKRATIELDCKIYSMLPSLPPFDAFVMHS